MIKIKNRKKSKLSEPESKNEICWFYYLFYKELLIK